MSQTISKFRKTFRDLMTMKTEIVYNMRHLSHSRYKRIYNLIVFMTSTAGMLSYLAFNTLFLYKYKDIVQMYSEGEGAKLDEKLELIALRVWNESHVPRRYKLLELIQFFPSVGSEPFSAGSLEATTGAILGLPHNFTYETIDDVKPSDMRFFGEHDPYMKWRSETGQQLLESLILSEKAKKFAIAREIYLTNTFRVHSNTIMVAVSCYLAIGLGQASINFLKVPRIFALRLLIRLVSIALGYVFYHFSNEVLELNWNDYAVESAANQGEDYLEGGLEYYEKLMKRNAALHILLGENGKKLYTPEGNFKPKFGVSLISIDQQLEKLKKIAESKAIEEKETEIDVKHETD